MSGSATKLFLPPSLPSNLVLQKFVLKNETDGRWESSKGWNLMNPCWSRHCPNFHEQLGRRQRTSGFDLSSLDRLFRRLFSVWFLFHDRFQAFELFPKSPKKIFPLDTSIILNKITHALFEYAQIGHVNFYFFFLKGIEEKLVFGFLSMALDFNLPRSYASDFISLRILARDSHFTHCVSLIPRLTRTCARPRIMEHYTAYGGMIYWIYYGSDDGKRSERHRPVS